MTEAKITPAMRQWHDMKALHPDKLLFFRMGDFYEMFHDDAVRGAKLLGLTLTRRGRDPNSPPLAGVPHHQIDRYIREAMEKGCSVAVCDQLEDPAEAKGTVKRGITRVLTPGTVVDEDILPPAENNYLAAATARGERAAVALLDISTGEFLVALPEAARLADVFARYRPAETLAPSGEAGDPASPLGRVLAAGLGGGVTRRDGYQFDPHEGATVLKSHFRVAALDAFGIGEIPEALGACGAILAYLKENQANDPAHIMPPRVQDDSGTMRIDRNTVRNLELAGAPRKRGGGTYLLDVLDRTLTGPGGRLLRNWLLAPPARLPEIHFRQAAVGELLADAATRRTLRSLLDRMADFERIMARVAAERANPRDLAALAAGARKLPDIAALAAASAAPLLRDCGRVDALGDLADMIEGALSPEAPASLRGGGINLGGPLAPEAPASLRDGGIIRDGADATVDEYREILGGGKDWMRAFQEKEQARTGISSLKVGFNKIFGFYIEITNAHRDKAPPEYARKQTLVNAERYITPELKAHEEKVLGAEEKLLALEHDLFRALRSAVAESIRRVQSAARTVALLDVVQSLAESGAEGRYVMPEVHEGLDTLIEEGRHPVAERLLPAGAFVENDVRFDADSQRVLIVTGPNMAGKSTYIRQAALFFIMAQMGGPVPAKSARIGLADRVFSRVGASDDLARGQSTFMVEMVETAEILHNATERSLIILDEVGRGTSTFDGVSLAWAITEYLHEKIRGRVLFATHYHELAELGHILARAKNYNVAVKDWEGEIVFLRKIQPGACDRSYGIHVARLAGVPAGVLRRAGEILAGLEEQASERDSKMLDDSRELLRAAAREVQLELFPSPKKMDELGKKLVRELADIDANLLSPMDALSLLARLSDKARGK